MWRYVRVCVMGCWLLNPFNSTGLSPNPLKTQNTPGFLMFSGGIEIDQCSKSVKWLQIYCSSFISFLYGKCWILVKHRLVRDERWTSLTQYFSVFQYFVTNGEEYWKTWKYRMKHFELFFSLLFFLLFFLFCFEFWPWVSLQTGFPTGNIDFHILPQISVSI